MIAALGGVALFVVGVLLVLTDLPTAKRLRVRDVVGTLIAATGVAFTARGWV